MKKGEKGPTNEIVFQDDDEIHFLIKKKNGEKFVVKVDSTVYFNIVQEWRWYFVGTKTAANINYVGRGYYLIEEGRKKHKTVYLHLEILGEKSKAYGDHIDGDPLNNRRSNLRESFLSENLWNRGKSKNNTSGYKGVSFFKSAGKFKARISRNGRRYFLGHFDNAVDAARAYDRAAVRMHGEFARLNNA